MWYDDYVGVIGSFCWYMYERIGGFEPAREQHPSTIGVRDRKRRQGDHGRLGRRREQRPGHARPHPPADLYKIAAKHANVPVKVSVGAGPANLAWHAHFKHYKNAKDLTMALCPIFNAEMKALVAAGATYLQFEDLGAWLPLFTQRQERLQVDPRERRDVLRRRGREDRLALLLRQRVGQRHPQRELPRRLSDGAAVLLRHRRASTSSCSTTPTATWPAWTS